MINLKHKNMTQTYQKCSPSSVNPLVPHTLIMGDGNSQSQPSGGELDNPECRDPGIEVQMQVVK